MLYCSNPSCKNPFNPDNSQICNQCGAKNLAEIFHFHYRVLKPLGEGGFGKVYQAIDIEKMNHPCVIKQFTPPNIDPQNQQIITQLFNQEAQQLHQLGKHSQIPELYAFFEQDKKLYLVQEFIEGQTLLQEFHQEGCFGEKKIFDLLNQLLPVLQFIHEKHLIHRDIKPENIMRRSSSRQGEKLGELILIDFGIAKQFNPAKMGQQGTIIGTPGYAPYEQIKFGEVNPSNDLYSLGATCIRLLTGCFLNLNELDPIYDSSKHQWHWQEKITKNITFNQNLLNILNKLILKNTNERYQSAQEVIEDLKTKIYSQSNSTLPKTEISTLNPRLVVKYNNYHVMGIILKQYDMKELNRISKESVAVLELRIDNQKIETANSFMYKQIIFPEIKKSRCYFLTNLELIKTTNNYIKNLQQFQTNKINIIAIWNQKEYSIKQLIIPQQALLKNETSSHINPLDFALFHIDIPKIEPLDFFGISKTTNIDIGDQPYQENAGGPIVNQLGEIVGISTQIFTSTIPTGNNCTLNIQEILKNIQNKNNLQQLTINTSLNNLKTFIT